MFYNCLYTLQYQSGQECLVNIIIHVQAVSRIACPCEAWFGLVILQCYYNYNSVYCTVQSRGTSTTFVALLRTTATGSSSPPAGVIMVGSSAFLRRQK